MRRARLSFFGAAALSFAACIDLSDLKSSDGDPGQSNDAAAEGSASLDGASTSDGNAGANADGGGDVVVVAPDNGFVVTLAPAHVTLDPGESTNVDVNLVRGTDFHDAVDITVQNLGANLTTNPPTVTIVATESKGSFTITAAGAASVPQDLTASVLAISKRDTSLSSSASLGVRIGSLLVATNVSTNVALPDWATELVVKVWGAGGGAGGALTTEPGLAWGGLGGGGGFASARVAIDAKQQLNIQVGSGGASGMDHTGAPITPHGGGGGGYSAVSQGATMLVVAGGGGGGAGGQAYNNSGHCYPDSVGTSGLNGGGGDGAPAPNSTVARSATQSSGGAADTSAGSTPGTALQGGAGSLPATAGGSPGGGQGGGGDDGCFGYGGGGGGGGGGWFGGGAGTGRVGINGSHTSGGGGGGSGMVITGAKSPLQSVATASGEAASTSDADYVAPAGAGGARGGASVGAEAGKGGRVVIRFAKP